MGSLLMLVYGYQVLYYTQRWSSQVSWWIFFWPNQSMFSLIVDIFRSMQQCICLVWPGLSCKTTMQNRLAFNVYTWVERIRHKLWFWYWTGSVILRAHSATVPRLTLTACQGNLRCTFFDMECISWLYTSIGLLVLKIDIISRDNNLNLYASEVIWVKYLRSRGSSDANIKYYAAKGTCSCKDTASCPTKASENPVAPHFFIKWR